MACAGSHHATLEQIDDACKALESPPPDLVLNQQDLEELHYKCQSQVEDELYRQRLEQEQRDKDAAEAARKQMEAEQAARAAKELEESKAQAARMAREDELRIYAQALEYGTSGECGEELEDDLHHYGILQEYVASPERNRAIASMEVCRKEYVARARAAAPSVVMELRREFAVSIEDAFDSANPYSSSRFVAKVEGSTLKVRMSGNFEGRARHSQTQVEAWCEASNAAMFSKTVLKNMHGTFSCRPSTWIGGPRVWADKVLQSAGALDPLSNAPGSKAAPAPLTEDAPSGPDPFD